MMRIVWGLHDSEADQLVCLFEAENLLTSYREQLLHKWWDELTRPTPIDTLPGDDDTTEYDSYRSELLDLGWERWRNAQVNDRYPRFTTVKYELWNSVPPNPERLTVHFDS